MNVELMNMCMIQNVQNGKVVVQNRIKSWKGLAFPGGHIEYGESLEQAMIREILEETGLTLKKLLFCGVKTYFIDGYYCVVFCYYSDEFDGELLHKTEEGELSWLNLDDLTVNNTPNGFLDAMPIFFRQHHECHYSLAGDKILY